MAHTSVPAPLTAQPGSLCVCLHLPAPLLQGWASCSTIPPTRAAVPAPRRGNSLSVHRGSSRWGCVCARARAHTHTRTHTQGHLSAMSERGAHHRQHWAGGTGGRRPEGRPPVTGYRSPGMWWAARWPQTGPPLGPPGRVLRADAELSPRGEACLPSVNCTRGGGCCLNLPGGHIPASKSDHHVYTCHAVT